MDVCGDVHDQLPHFLIHPGKIIMKYSILVAAVLAAVALSACEKPSVVVVPATTAALPGPAGPQGATGDAGTAGSSGATGAAGNIGADGAKGDSGKTGTPGTDGAKGDTGKTGGDTVVIVPAPAEQK
jgi:Collagen triple helix repeat (20 copies)